MSKTGTIKWFSFFGLGLSLIPAMLVLAGTLAKETHLWCMFVGMLVWFSTAVFWIRPDHQ